MSLLLWLSRKLSARRQAPGAVASGAQAAVASGQPSAAGAVPARATARPDAAAPVNRKTERLERRELLYDVVRQSMTRAGVLSASYKFKVLSLDPRGRQYLIMMELANHMAGETGRMMEIESLIAQTARTRHDLAVTAVYWRVNEQVGAALSRPQVPMSTQGTGRLPAPAVAGAAARAPRIDPMYLDEAVVLRQLVPGGTQAAALTGSGQVVGSWPDTVTIADFEDTERVAREERKSPLSGTQYGDLS